jgi:hypothetical protein
VAEAESQEPEEAVDPAKDSPKKPEDGVPASPEVRALNSLAEDDLRKRSRALDLERQESDLGLSKAVGWGTLGLMAAQVVAVDAGFFWYAGENNWKMPSNVIVAQVPQKLSRLPADTPPVLGPQKSDVYAGQA